MPKYKLDPFFVDMVCLHIRQSETHEIMTVIYIYNGTMEHLQSLLFVTLREHGARATHQLDPFITIKCQWCYASLSFIHRINVFINTNYWVGLGSCNEKCLQLQINLSNLLSCHSHIFYSTVTTNTTVKNPI